MDLSDSILHFYHIAVEYNETRLDILLTEKAIYILYLSC